MTNNHEPIININYNCGCGFTTIYLREATDHTITTGHTLHVLGSIRPIGKEPRVTSGKVRAGALQYV
jgi:hypothetical protein